MIERLPYILMHQHISRLGGDMLYIGDRRAFPFEKREVAVSDYKMAAKAIKDMVTQGGGPLEVALNAMLMTYRQNPDELDNSCRLLSEARPTNRTVARELSVLMDMYKNGNDFEESVMAIFSKYDNRYDRMSDYGESLIKSGMGILTTCFPEHSFILSVYKAVRNGKDVRVYVPETRPYFQGAHLTEPSLRELGIEVYLISDGMPAHFMREGKIDLYMTAADMALADKTVVNKVGTLSNAIAAKHYGIDYYAFSAGLDYTKKKEDIVIEYRSGDEMKCYKGAKIAEDDAKYLYPCFDIIDSDLVSGIITEEGILR